MPKSKRNKVGASAEWVLVLSCALLGALRVVFTPRSDIGTLRHINLLCCLLLSLPLSNCPAAVNLTKAKKKDRAWKEGLVSQVRKCIEE